MTNLIGLQRRPADDGGTAQKWIGPLHAVEGAAGRAAVENSSDVRALCGQWVQVVPVQEVPDDAGLCQACQYGD